MVMMPMRRSRSSTAWRSSPSPERWFIAAHWIGQSSGLTSYEGLATQIDAAVHDPSIRGIALEIDSFGGEVAGAFDLADHVRAARDTKPVHAFLAEHALSAGYALASQATRITLPRTGAAGSIGVITMHTDMSGMLAQKGVAVTLIHAGAQKADGNPVPPCPKVCATGCKPSWRICGSFSPKPSPPVAAPE